MNSRSIVIEWVWLDCSYAHITSFHIDSDCVIASFDVNSLFTDVLLTESVNLCCDLLFRISDLNLRNECKILVINSASF